MDKKMGEIIHVDFGSKKRIEKEAEKTDEPSEAVKAFEDILNLEENADEKSKELIRFMKLMTSDILEKIKNLQTSQETLRDSRELVKNYKTEALFDWLENANENDIKKKASFFKAIVEELGERILK